MSKKLLLTAGAVAALAIAGAAQAGDLSVGSTISGVAINGLDSEDEEVAAVTYQLASERNIPANGFSTDYTALANRFLHNNLTNEISVAANSGTLTFVVTYNLTGPGKFENVSAAAVSLGTLGSTSVTPILSNNGTTLTVFVNVVNSGMTPVLIDSVSTTGFDLNVTAKGTVALSYTLAQVIGSQNVTLDTSDAANIITQRSAISSFFTATNRSVLAALPDFESFATGTGISGGNLVATSGTVGLVRRTGVYADLEAVQPASIGAIVDTVDVTVTGPQVEDLAASFGGIELPEDATATSALFEDIDGDDINGDTLVLTADGDTVITQGQYAASFVPTYASGWAGTASQARNLITVNLDGTNFFAPWFALNNAGTDSTLRIGNTGGAATGPIVITMRARRAGSTATTTTATFPGVPAGGFSSITGTALKAAFGTDTNNADLLVSIQSSAFGVVSAKVRTTQPSGQVFENSLDLLAPLDASSADVAAIQAAIANVDADLADARDVIDIIDANTEE
jgi:hypothetical protein